MGAINKNIRTCIWLLELTIMLLKAFFSLQSLQKKIGALDHLFANELNILCKLGLLKFLRM
jgi:hypothetical protein